MAHSLPQNFLKTNDGKDLLVQFVEGEKSIQILDWQNSVKKKLSVNNIVSMMREYETTISAAEITNIVQEFVDNVEHDQAYSCGSLTILTKNVRIICNS